jgi:hypothetical protein
MRSAKPYIVRLDQEGAEWLTSEAERLFTETRDYGWDEIARDLRHQIDAERSA